jgi:large subunit ribosomal protein L24
MPLRIKKNDTVKVINGRDKGKTGRVLEVLHEKNRVLVEHVMMMKKHTRPNPARQVKGGIAERESSIHLSNVMLMCPTCNAPRRIGIREERDPAGRRVRASRVCRKCGELLDK